MTLPRDNAERQRAARQPSCPDYLQRRKKHRHQRRITASADGTRAALSLARGTSACPRSGSSENRLEDLFGKSARTFCRYLHRGPSSEPGRGTPTVRHRPDKVEGLNNLAIETLRSWPCHATFGRIACYAMAATNLSRIHR